MPYCVHCGVEVDAGIPACPLCKTPIFDPCAQTDSSAKPLYPPTKAASIPKLSRRVIFILLALFYLIPTAVTVICDLSLGGGISWSLLVLGAAAILTANIALLLYADLLRSYGKVLVSGLLWSVYTAFVEYWLHGELRISFALPLVVYGALAIAALVLFARLTKKRPHPLLVVALLFLELGGACVLIECSIHVFFEMPAHAPWCVYPAGTAVLLAGLFAVIDRSNSLKAKLKKKLFI